MLLEGVEAKLAKQKFFRVLKRLFAGGHGQTVPPRFCSRPEAGGTVGVE
jgi:hypothetical protein